MFCVDIDFSPSFSVTRPRVDLMTTSARAFTTRHLTNILRNVYAFLSLGRLYHSVHGAFGSPSFRGTAGDHKGPPNHSPPPSPLREGDFTRKDGEPRLLGPTTLRLYAIQ